MTVAGIGFRAAATVGSLRDALHMAIGDTLPDAIAVPADKAAAPAVRALAAELDVRIVPVTPQALQSVRTPTQSAKVIEKRGTGSVAEACALAVAGPQAALITTRHISSDRLATCALAKRDCS